MTPSRSPSLQVIDVPLVDGENNAVTLDAAYRLRRDDLLLGAIDRIVQHHGADTRLLPLSARSGGGGIFQVSAHCGEPVIGLAIEPVAEPRVRVAERCDIHGLPLDEIVVIPDAAEVVAGAGITLDQLNRAVVDTLGPTFRVLGADLTSYTYAQVGATFMTGGMGPQRRYFSDSVIEIALSDGQDIRLISGNDLEAYAGTYGWTGIVTAVRCRIVRVPSNEFAFALPVDSAPDAVAALLDHLSPWCYLAASDNGLANQRGGPDLMLGIEHVTLASMAPMLAGGDVNAITRRANGLAQKCSDAGCDGLVFINGYSEGSVDELLFTLVDDVESDYPTIANINLEHSEVFPDAELMRAVREGIPFAARTQAPSGEFSFKGHTDATIRLNPVNVMDSMRTLWRINESYVQALQDGFAEMPGVEGQVLVYGHMNPWGVDPHNRLTLASDDQASYETAVAFAHEQLAVFYRALNDLCQQTGSVFVGGEKGAGSEREILAAFDRIASAPTGLQQKFTRQSAAIKQASPRFNWRALPPYLAASG